MNDPASAPIGQSRSVRLLRVVQHLLVTSMVVLALVRSAFDGGATTSELVMAAVVLGWYWAGWFATLRWSWPSPQLWLAVLTAACLLAVWISADFAWVTFAVFVTYATTLGPRVAVVAIVALAAGTGAILVSRWPSDGHWAAQVVGPLVGAAAAGALVGVGRLAAAEATERQHLVEELLATRDDLALAHLEAGALGERERLTREIHDTLAQGFTSVVLAARRARHAIATGDTDSTAVEIDHLEALGQGGVDGARRLMCHLTPVELDDRTLPAALAMLAAPAPRPGSPTLDLRVDGDVYRLPDDIEGALLRVVQEAMANTRRHARAERVVITLTYQPSTVSLDVVDDGIGFDPFTVGSRGFGLTSMRSRVEQLGGAFHIDSEPGHGTSVNVTIERTPAEQGRPT